MNVSLNYLSNFLLELSKKVTILSTNRIYWG